MRLLVTLTLFQAAFLEKAWVPGSGKSDVLWKTAEDAATRVLGPADPNAPVAQRILTAARAAVDPAGPGWASPKAGAAATSPKPPPIPIDPKPAPTDPKPRPIAQPSPAAPVPVPAAKPIAVAPKPAPKDMSEEARAERKRGFIESLMPKAKDGK
jgi:hypothetical protein